MVLDLRCCGKMFTFPSWGRRLFIPRSVWCAGSLEAKLLEMSDSVMLRVASEIELNSSKLKPQTRSDYRSLPLIIISRQHGSINRPRSFKSLREVFIIRMTFNRTCSASSRRLVFWHFLAHKIRIVLVSFDVLCLVSVGKIFAARLIQKLMLISLLEMFRNVAVS